MKNNLFRSLALCALLVFCSGCQGRNAIQKLFIQADGDFAYSDLKVWASKTDNVTYSKNPDSASGEFIIFVNYKNSSASEDNPFMAMYFDEYTEKLLTTMYFRDGTDASIMYIPKYNGEPEQCAIISYDEDDITNNQALADKYNGGKLYTTVAIDAKNKSRAVEMIDFIAETN